MTSPEDDSVEAALRRALSEAASEVEPGTDGLEKIRARIDGRHPRPWLISMLVGIVDRIRHWTWRGHFAWQDSLPGLRARWRPRARWGRRSRRSNFPGWGIGWLRLVTVVSGIAVLAGIALGVQPFRHAILQASSSLNGGGGSPRGSAGTEGNGAQANGASGTPTAGGSSAGPGGRIGTVADGKSPGTAHPTGNNGCATSKTPAASVTPTHASAAAKAPTTAPATEVPSPSAPSATAPTQPVYPTTGTSAPPTPPTCPVIPPSGTPTPSTSSSSAAPTSGSEWTQSSAPTESQSPAPTEATSAAGGPGWSSPSTPSWAGQSRPQSWSSQQRWHSDDRNRHAWWR